MQPTWQAERLPYNGFHLTGKGSNVVGQAPRLASANSIGDMAEQPSEIEPMT